MGMTSTDSARTEKKQSFIYEQQVKPKLDLLKKKTALSKQPPQIEFPPQNPQANSTSNKIQDKKAKIKFKRLELPENVAEPNSDEAKLIPSERKQELKIPNKVPQFQGIQSKISLDRKLSPYEGASKPIATLETIQQPGPIKEKNNSQQMSEKPPISPIKQPSSTQRPKHVHELYSTKNQIKPGPMTLTTNQSFSSLKH